MDKPEKHSIKRYKLGTKRKTYHSSVEAKTLLA
jgi:hypothetical protein